MMNEMTLPPETSDTPPSPDSRQVERRLERALTGDYQIQNLGPDPMFSQFAVTSSSGRTYEVVIRHLKLRANSCSCPDFQVNLIGTCKHIEAVLVRAHRPAHFRDSLAPAPDYPQLYLEYGEELSLRLLRPPASDPVLAELMDRNFDVEGAFKGDPGRDLPAFLEAARALGRIEVSPDVHDHVKTVREASKWDAERHRYLERLERGEKLKVTRCPLLPYQERGAIHLATTRTAVLADESGLGKTVQAIAASELLRREHGVRKILILCPNSLRHHWFREIARFTGNIATVIEGTPEERAARFALGNTYTVVGYEQLPRDGELIRRLDPHVTILDEAERIQNWRSKTAQAVRDIRSPFRWTLMSTTLEDRLDELYSVMQFVDQRLLGALWHFNRRFFIFDGKKVLGTKNMPELRKKLARVMLHRTRREVLAQLPASLDNFYFLPLTREQQKVHDDEKGQLSALLEKVDGGEPDPRLAEDISKRFRRLITSCTAPGMVQPESLTPAPKLAELLEILPEWTHQGGKAVVLTGWDAMAELTSQALESVDMTHVTLKATATAAKRRRVLQQFATDPELPVLVATDAAVRGLDLQEARVLVNLDWPWDPAEREQRIACLHKLGSSRGVHVVNLVAEGSIEERLVDMMQRGMAAFTFSGKTRGVKGEPAFPDFRSVDTLDDLRTLLGPGARENPSILMSGGIPVEPPATRPEPATAALAVETPAAGADPVLVISPHEAMARRAASRLKAARCLLEGGLPGECVPPAYEAMQLACRLLLGGEAMKEGPPPRDILARLYAGPVREGRLAPALVAGFSRARDLADLAESGAADLVDIPVAREVVDDAEAFHRLLTGGHGKV